MRALVTGATGLIGQRLVRGLDGAAALTRSPARAAAELPGVHAWRWDPMTEAAPAKALQGIDVVFHLAGEPIAGARWTDEQRRRIRDSRVSGTRHLVAGFRALAVRPRVLVSASATGYYGDRGDEELDEASSRGSGFLAQVCADWEAEAMAAAELGLRVVCVRIGVVLAPGGGALARMLTPFRLGLGGRLAGGRQWMSWIHIDDLAGLLLHAAADDRIHGAMNAVAPEPVTNQEFTRALGAAVHRPAFLRVPAFALRVAFGDLAGILTASQRVVPRVALGAGYRFAQGRLAGALASVASSRRGAAIHDSNDPLVPPS
ncbi:MAG: TIGR01777 family oxidoreductase [Polyangiaceae bacterium]|nr:TIGR01777 family oxidoreductase [Polyangiaceae bacterium]